MASEHQEVHYKNTKESHGENYRQPSVRIVRHPRGSRDVFTYTVCAEGHTQMVAHHTRPKTFLQDWGGGDYKIHGNTHHSGPPASKQLTILHQVLRWLWNWHMGSLEICTKQDRPYHVARRVATEGKGPIQ